MAEVNFVRDQNLYYASFDGSKWSAQTQIPGVASGIGPALSEFNGKLYAMWKGSDTARNDGLTVMRSIDSSVTWGVPTSPGP
jgi:hypothetical protein